MSTKKISNKEKNLDNKLRKEIKHYREKIERIMEYEENYDMARDNVNELLDKLESKKPDVYNELVKKLDCYEFHD